MVMPACLPGVRGVGGARLTEDVRDAGEGLAVSVRGGFGPDELGEEKCSSAASRSAWASARACTP